MIWWGYAVFLADTCMRGWMVISVDRQNMETVW